MSAPLAATIDAAARRLAAAGVASPRLDARLLVGHALGLDPAAIIAAPDRAVTVAERRRIARVVARRARREPVSRIIGRREFWSLEFRITPATLDPRPDSETLVQAVLDRLPDRAAELALLDLGTGSGCLLLALLHELGRARGLGIDIVPAAVRAARRNAKQLGLATRARFVQGDWGAARDRRFDIVVSNPPYIAEPELAGLAPELAFEPRQALVAGPDGLAAYRTIAGLLPGLLAPKGLAALEVGAGQAGAVAELLGKAGLTVLGRVADLAGHARVVLAEHDD